MNLRPARAGDLPAIMAIEVDVFPDSAWTVDQMRDELSRDTRWYTVAEDSDALIGYLGLYVVEPDCDLQTIAVSPNAHGRGVGTALLGAAVAHAWSVGCSRMFLEVRADNDAALRLYERTGFVRLGRRSRYYPDGADAVTMRLRRHEVPDLAEAVHA
ncbi:MAG: ribosomal protein S18-alanine N-acetyltransferase [Candidatus Nanopelagicales bacterium]